MIFCVEDDAGIRELMVYTLNASGFEAAGFPDGAALFAALEKQKPQLIMLDIMLPGEDGISILKKLRSRSATESIHKAIFFMLLNDSVLLFVFCFLKYVLRHFV